MRQITFQTDYYYHIYNRGVDKREIFLCDNDYARFISGLNDFNNSLTREERNNPAIPPSPELSSEVVEIVCYCLLPNHFHLLLKQTADDGIKKFMHKLGTGHTNYFNLKNDRSGSLFEGSYKAIKIEKDGHFNRLVGYINGNAEIHSVAKADAWKWGSYPDFISERDGKLNRKEEILKEFENISEFKKFVNLVIADAKERKLAMKNYLE